MVKVLLFIIVLLLLFLNLGVMFKVEYMVERIDDNLVDIEMMKMKVEKVTEDLSVDVFLLQEKIGRL